MVQVVVTQLIQSPMQIEKRPFMGRQHQHAVGDHAQPFDRVQPVTQWIGFWFRDIHRNGRGNTGQHLIARNQQPIVRRVQTRMLR